MTLTTVREASDLAVVGDPQKGLVAGKHARLIQNRVRVSHVSEMTKDKRKGLRQMVEEVTRNTVPSRHPDLIENLRGEYDHTIELVGNRYYMDSTNDCFTHALGEKIRPDLLARLQNLGQDDETEGQNLFNELVKNGVLCSLHDRQEQGDRIVVYFNGNDVKHFGKICGNRIESKWGRGHVWQHDVWEVPASYGSTARYCSSNVDDAALESVIGRLEKCREQGKGGPGDAQR